jgi:hypothetical protein
MTGSRVRILFGRGEIYFLGKCFPMGLVKREITTLYPETIKEFTVHRTFKGGEIIRKVAWDSVFNRLETGGHLQSILKNLLKDE